MGVFKGLSWLLGFVQIKIHGPAMEKFINMAISRGIYLWDIRRKKDGSVTAKVRLDSFRPLKNIARKQDSRLRIEQKAGLPFWLRRAKKRHTFFVGALFFAIALYGFSSFVWTVEVAGELKNTERERILQEAAQLGVAPGAWKPNLDKQAIEKALERKIPELAWVGMQVRGTTVILEVHEWTLPPQGEYVGPAHLVAAKDGLVEEVLVMQGVAVVKKGDTVKKGQLLVSGLIFPPAPTPEGEEAEGPPPPVEPPKRVQAKGAVKARIWYEAYGEAKLLDLGQEETGRIESQLRMKILGREIIVRGPKTPSFAAYREEKQGGEALGWRNLRLPVEVNKVYFYELTSYRREQTLSSAEAQAKEGAMAKIRQQLPADAALQRVDATPIPTGDSNLVRVRVIVEAVEEIGQILPLQEAPGTGGSGSTSP